MNDNVDTEVRRFKVVDADGNELNVIAERLWFHNPKSLTAMVLGWNFKTEEGAEVTVNWPDGSYSITGDRRRFHCLDPEGPLDPLQHRWKIDDL
ncbi:MAG: hypothetical protein JNG89_18960 [Planctomycetaceae bacterium]|nr:hypothetical protein [Planctomycetaceae bacterium]